MQPSIAGPVYRILTDRLVIRCWNPEDAPLLEEAIQASVEHLKPFMPWAYNEPEELEKKIERIRRWRSNFDRSEDYIYGIFSPDGRRVIGGTGLHTRVGEGAREIGYWIHANETGHGYATEASAALTRVAFEVDRVKRVEIHCDPRNKASARVAEKLGYTHEGTLRQRFHFKDELWVDTMIWTLFSEDYAASPSASSRIQAFDAAGRQIL